MTNFQPEQASDNVAAPTNTSDVNSMQSVYSDLGSSYMREAASLSGSSSSSDNSSRSSSDLQESLNAGLQSTDQLYGSTVDGDKSETSEAPKPEAGDLRSEMQRRAEHRSDVVHDRPEMSMARSAGGGWGPGGCGGRDSSGSGDKNNGRSGESADDFTIRQKELQAREDALAAKLRARRDPFANRHSA